MNSIWCRRIRYAKTIIVLRVRKYTVAKNVVAATIVIRLCTRIRNFTVAKNQSWLVRIVNLWPFKKATLNVISNVNINIATHTEDDQYKCITTWSLYYLCKTKLKKKKNVIQCIIFILYILFLFSKFIFFLKYHVYVLGCVYVVWSFVHYVQNNIIQIFGIT